MEKQKQKESSCQINGSERQHLISKIFKTRKQMNLPTDDHMVNFINHAMDNEIKEVWEGLEELTKIFEITGSKTFASEQAV